MIYLDSAATSLLKPAAVTTAVAQTMTHCASPSRGSYSAAMDAAEVVYSCREEAAALFHAAPEQVVFTQNATHALNLAIHALVKPGTKVLISGYEHNAVLRPLAAMGAEISVIRSPLFDREAALQAFREKLADCELVVCTHVSNVFGFVLPIEELSAECKKAGVPLIVDAAQSAGTLEVDMRAWDCAFIAMPGHKGLMGPQGTGILLCNHETRPLLYGGTGTLSRSLSMPDALPERLEAGTLNVPGIAGLLEGLRYVRRIGASLIHQKEQHLMKTFLSHLVDERIHAFVSPNDGSQSAVVSVCFEGLDSESAAELLGREGIAVRGGLHCAPLAHETAGTIEQGTVRFSFSPFLTLDEVRKAAITCEQILKNGYNL